MGSDKLIKDCTCLLESSKDITANVTSIKKLKKSFEDSQNCSNNFRASSYGESVNIKDTDRNVVISLLLSSPVTYESIVDETNFSLPTIYTICLELELSGRIIRYPRNKISLIY
jgi:predicted Rossmann fold nucleotide-binding protein DprA/Smf involved in DNA uptake